MSNAGLIRHSSQIVPVTVLMSLELWKVKTSLNSNLDPRCSSHHHRRPRSPWTAGCGSGPHNSTCWRGNEAGAPGPWQRHSEALRSWVGWPGPSSPRSERPLSLFWGVLGATPRALHRLGKRLPRSHVPAHPFSRTGRMVCSGAQTAASTLEPQLAHGSSQGPSSSPGPMA